MAVKKRGAGKSAAPTKKNPMASALESISSIYKDAKEQAKSFSGEAVPDGNYELRLTGIKFMEKEKDGVTKLSLLRTFSVLSGENEGMTQTDFMSLTNPTGLSFAMQFLSKMGYEIPDSPSDWPEIIEDLQETMPACIGEIVTSDAGFTNVRVSELIDLDGDESEDSEDEEEELRERLEGMTRAQLKAFKTKEGLVFKILTKYTDEDLIELILEEVFG